MNSFDDRTEGAGLYYVCARSVFLFVASILVPLCSADAQDAKGLTANYTDCVYPGDQIVTACTRNYPSVVGRTLDLHTFVGFGCDAHGRCTHEPIQLLEGEGFVETWIFIHGNQISETMAVERGAKVYRKLRSCSVYQGPIRFIIWSWPSERTTNRIADAKIKEKRTDAESFFFGSFLAATDQDTPTSILAYSFGARIASGGLHLADGGQLGGRCLPNRATPSVPYRVAFLAAAVENDGVLSGGRYHRALNHAERLLLQNNSRDRALRFYWILNRTKPTALGHSGLNCSPLHCPVVQYDWGKTIGKDHSLWQYIDRRIIRQRVLETIAR